MTRRRGIFGILVRTAVVVAIALPVLVLGLVALWSVAPPVSTLMLGRLVEGKGYERDYVRLNAVAPVAVASIIASEDARFCRNDGVDWDALHEVIAEADADGPSRGASTITMQTAKNLFLWPGRSTVRKGIEIVLALILGRVWSKAHVIEVYLNIAEWATASTGSRRPRGATSTPARETSMPSKPPFWRRRCRTPLAATRPIRGRSSGASPAGSSREHATAASGSAASRSDEALIV